MQQTPPGNFLARRLGLIAFLMIVLVFGSELTLSQFRRRDVTIAVSVSTAQATTQPTGQTTTQPATASPVPPTNMPPTSGPGPTNTPAPAVLEIHPEEGLIVDVKWNYRIGPRFPRTIIRATIQINERSVAQGQVAIDCGTALLECVGSDTIPLRYTIGDTGTGPQTVPWPIGDYVLLVDRSLGELTYTPLQKSEFHVR